MGTSQKVLTTTLWGLMVLAMLGLIGTGLWATRRASRAPELPVLFNVPTFTLLDQDRAPVTDAKLRGKPWVACFVFTNCAGPCPLMFTKMVEMQHELKAAGARQVCFSVDPERDTPEVLKAKAKDLDADVSNWSFLTADRPTVDKLLRDMFQPKPQDGDSPLMHDSKFYLFDAQGQCRGRYSSNSDDDIKKLKKDAAALAADAPDAGGKLQ